MRKLTRSTVSSGATSWAVLIGVLVLLPLLETPVLTSLIDPGSLSSHGGWIDFLLCYVIAFAANMIWLGWIYYQSHREDQS